MTREHAQKEREAFIAFADGRDIEVSAAGCWVASTSPTFDSAFDHRVKPEPTYVPWGPEDVPPVCYVRRIGDPSATDWIVTGVSIHGVYVGNDWHSWDDLMKVREYSTTRKDGSWLPCRKEVV